MSGRLHDGTEAQLVAQGIGDAAGLGGMLGEVAVMLAGNRLADTADAGDEGGGRRGGRGPVAPSKLVGPIRAVLPVGIDFLTRPFAEPTLFRIAAAYEQATKLRRPPPDFGPLPPQT